MPSDSRPAETFSKSTRTPTWRVSDENMKNLDSGPFSVKNGLINLLFLAMEARSEPKH